MRDPFDNQQKGKGWSRLLDFDAWIDSSMYRFMASGGETWESVTIFFRRFRITGFKKALVEIFGELLTLGVAGSVLFLALALPAFEETEKNWQDQADYSVVFLDRYGKQIGQRGIRQDNSMRLETLPDYFIKAVLSTEDRRFFDHLGIDFYGLSRAMAENVRANSVVQGGSTITQQLAKNLFLTNERTFVRKIKEAFLSVWLEWNLSKKEILKLYLDRAYMGGGNFGIGAAAKFYFGKDINDVSLAESAMLAGLFKAPTKYAPHINLPAARARANEVLTNMVQAGYMSEGQVIGSRRKPAVVIERDGDEGPNYYLDWAFEETKRISIKFPTRTLIAKTTADLELQKAAEESVNSHLQQHGKAYGVTQAAMVAIEHDGSLRAMVGGRDYGASQFNRATSAIRQPGSSFKPFVYAAAIENFGYNQNTRVTDDSVCLKRSRKVWCPRNYSGRFRGQTNFTTALVKSINTIPVRLYVGKGNGLKALGGKRITATARAMGITSPLVENPAMVLGANGLTVLEMASGYGTFMSGGHKLDVHTITQIYDTSGNLLFDYKKQGPGKVRALKDKTVAAMNKMLVQVPEWGTARRAKLEGIRAAGKTGTTQAYRDAWFVGYTGNFVAAVWFGNDNYKSTRRLTGGRLPAMTWKKFMSFAHQNIEIRPIPYVDPIKETKKTKIAKAKAAQNKKVKKEIIRPKTLSRKSEDALRALEKIFKSTPMIKLDRKIADIPRDTAVQSN
ncbi:MAG: PBP1A family penicillin-binding protein [Hyphomicrobiales bacterium]|nr:PBP1A family penicillin-binding protein [Hyphomicrobiales bacterium]